ncbi:hypothetical protein C3941_19600 [Kaistia algarum]|uniref:hypothetical protein n=1 Tax=Kaistia algarum TaxID=2083279 RepID=UPI000CE795C1|nr:hypothetical protein [Kaistia algarum]MCX5516198.1 hypothetical protein [Kaistia algarum]PPE78272.1 hypothetical protein C3941_19600 [Kaistia algarum]
MKNPLVLREAEHAGALCRAQFATDDLFVGQPFKMVLDGNGFTAIRRLDLAEARRLRDWLTAEIDAAASVAVPLRRSAA